MWRLELNFENWAIDSVKTLNFLEPDIISVLEAVSLVLMTVDESFSVLSDSNDDGRSALFSIFIVDDVLVTIIDEGKAVNSEVAGINKANLVVSTSMV